MIIRDLAMWAVWNVPLGRLAPYVMGFACGAKGFYCVNSGTGNREPQIALRSAHRPGASAG